MRRLGESQRETGEVRARWEEEARSKESWRVQFENGREQNRKLVELL